jgi:rhodanese-related sulfurtransferase
VDQRKTASVLTLIALFVSTTFAYTNLTPAQLHLRLARCDSLQLVDVREWSEYKAGHIAEPHGQLPLFPACLPWNSGVFQAGCTKLARNIDVVISCKSGARSASAAAFLEQKGYTRVFAVTGGFVAWDAAGYEKRTGGIGRGTGAWMKGTFTNNASIDNDSAHAVLYPAAFTGFDSVYCEISYAYDLQPAPVDWPFSDVAGLFRVSLLDKNGLPLFAGDSLVLADTVGLTFVPRSKRGTPLVALTDTGISTLAGVWRPVAFDYAQLRFHRSEKILRRWYSVAGLNPLDGVRIPFANRTVLSTGAARGVYDLRGRCIGRRDQSGRSAVTGIVAPRDDRSPARKLLLLR